MRVTTRAKAMAAAATLAVLACLAPAARAHDDVRVVVRGPRVGVSFGFGHARECRWVPGRWVETVQRVVVRPGYWRTEVVPAAWEVRFDLARWRFTRVCVRTESVRRVWVPPCHEDRVVRSWAPGRWECRDGCHG